MAVDTPEKRRAMLSMRRRVLPIPSGASTAIARFTYLRVYYIALVVILSQTPLARTLAVLFENRVVAIDAEDRIYPIEVA